MKILKSFLCVSVALSIYLEAHLNKAMSATSESGNYINIQSFGATPNASKNDSEAIQDAIDFITKEKANNGGGVVFIPRGNYLINKTIEVKDNVTLLGEGSSNSWEIELGK